LINFFQKNTKLILLALIALVLAVRIPSLGSRPLWYDEAISILLSRTGPKAMLQGTLGLADGTAANVHPLLYFTLLWGWMLLFGQKVIVVRFLSVLIHLALLIVLWYLAQEMFGLKQEGPTRRQALSMDRLWLLCGPCDVYACPGSFLSHTSRVIPTVFP
jgi:uncharacterized membrane protein